MVRHALVLALALAVTLAGATVGCRAAEPDRQKEAPKGALPATASATIQPTIGEGERAPIDGGHPEIPTGMPSSSASKLEANHNPKGSEPERNAF